MTGIDDNSAASLKKANQDERQKEYARVWYLRNRTRVIAAAKERMRLFRLNNPDEYKKVARERAKRWRQRQPAHHRATVNAWRNANREKLRAQDLARRLADPETHRARQRIWREKNKATICAKRRKHYAGLSPESRAAGHRARARRMQASGEFTGNDWRRLIARSPVCYYCGRKWTKLRRPTHDHVIPLSKGGNNSPSNSVCACLECNSRKGTKLINPVTGQFQLL